MKLDEETHTIRSSDDQRIEARIHRGDGEGIKPRLALLCHPHPLYGGTMDNNVVLAARDTAAALGSSTLRFNFRGVGSSSGRFDDGRGEQRDLEACFSYAQELGEGPIDIDLVAYSFGAWVAAKALSSGLAPSSVSLISPPADFMSFDGLHLPQLPTLVVSGDRDEFGSLEAVDRWLASWKGEVERRVFEGVDHFYWGAKSQLQEALKDFLGGL